MQRSKISCVNINYLKNCFVTLMPSFASGHLQWCYYAMNAAGGFSSLAINLAKTIRDCSGTWQF